MFTSLPLVVLGAIAAARVGVSTEIASFADIVDQYADCAKPCVNDMFDELLKDQCGDVKTSTTLEDTECVCTTGSAADGTKYGEEVLAQCYLDKCGSDVSTSEVFDPALDLLSWCTGVIAGDSTFGMLIRGWKIIFYLETPGRI